MPFDQGPGPSDFASIDCSHYKDKEDMSLIAFLSAFLKILANPALISGLAALLSKMLRTLGH